MTRGLCSIASLLLVLIVGADPGAMAADSLLFSMRVPGAGDAVASGSVRLGLRVTGAGAAVGVVPAGTLSGCRGGRCYYEYPAGTVVQLSAHPSQRGSQLATWVGGCTGAASVCSLPMDEDKTVTARFTPVQLIATPRSGMGGRLVLSPPGESCGRDCRSYSYGTRVSIVAEANDGYAFIGWNGVCRAITRGRTCSFGLFGGAVTSPRFVCTRAGCPVRHRRRPVRHRPLPNASLVPVTVKVAGSGSVTGKNFVCSNVCKFQYPRRAQVPLTARRSGFQEWRGSCRGSDQRCLVQAFRDEHGNGPSVTAVFR
jgi:hypothetical protein